MDLFRGLNIHQFKTQLAVQQDAKEKNGLKMIKAFKETDTAFYSFSVFLSTGSLMVAKSTRQKLSKSLA